ncbi:MAG: hypothetical protein L0211_03495 [Planctomycetaceae bacterium]|nr:hypothetical protein [Planctomycetaceae bacterium]
MDSSTFPQTPGQQASNGPHSISWQRIVLLVVLLNAPLFCDGCDAGKYSFSVGTVVPYAQITTPHTPDRQRFFPIEITCWSSWRCLANFLVIASLIWLLTRHNRRIARVAESGQFTGTLIAVAVAFNSWWFLPEFWLNVVFMLQWHLSMYLLYLFQGIEGPSDASRHSLLTSAWLLYAVCVVVLSATLFGVNAFFRRYFFAASGKWWQIQLGGLIIVVVVLGTLVGLVARLLLHS